MDLPIKQYEDHSQDLFVRLNCHWTKELDKHPYWQSIELYSVLGHLVDPKRK